MAFCTNCGKELSSFTVVCPACGCEVQGRQAADSVRKFYVDITHAQTTKEKAYLIKEDKLPAGEFGVMHGRMPVSQLKKVAHGYHASLNEYFVAVLSVIYF